MILYFKYSNISITAWKTRDCKKRENKVERVEQTGKKYRGFYYMDHIYLIFLFWILVLALNRFQSHNL